MQQHVRRTGHKQVARRTGWRSRSDPAIGGWQRERAISAFPSKQSSSSIQQSDLGDIAGVKLRVRKKHRRGRRHSSQ